MHINRRNMLKMLSLGAGTYALTPWQVTPTVAETKKPLRNFIFCYFQGGWDHLLCLDPRDPNVFTEGKKKETKIELAWDRIKADMPNFKDGTPFNPKELITAPGSKIELGPVMAPFKDHIKHSCIVRGLSMDTVTHQVGRRYFLTGKTPQGLNANGSSVPTQIVAQQGDLSIIPNLAVRVESYNRGLSAFASGLKVSSVSDLLSTLKDGSLSPKDEMRLLLEAYRRDVADCDPVSLNADGLLSLIKLAQHKSRVLVESDLGKLFNFNDTKNSEMVKIKKDYGITGSLVSGQAQAAMAFQAIKNQIAQCVSIEIARSLDTHGEEWSSNQPQFLYDGFKALSQLVKDLSETPHPRDPNKKLLHYTTVVVFSEFSRTPLLNNRDGRDHSLVNSAMLIGAGIPTNRVIGASSDVGLNPEAINPDTGERDPTGNLILTPTLLMASLMQHAGYNVQNFRKEGLPCLMSDGNGLQLD